MHSKIGFWAVLVSAVVLVLPVFAAFNEQLAGTYGTADGSNAPVFRGVAYHGKTISLDDYKGQNLLLVFASPGCPYCKMKVPLLNSIDEDGDLKVLMVLSADAQKTAEFKKTQGAEFEIIADSDYRISRTYGIRSVPQAFIIGSEGRIVLSTVSDGAGIWQQLGIDYAVSDSPAVKEAAGYAAADGGSTGQINEGSIPCTTYEDCPYQSCHSAQCINNECVYTVSEDSCYVDGRCVLNGTLRTPHDICAYCDVSVSQTQWSFVQAGTACDDFDNCTYNDQCSEGQCSGIPYSCDDGLECTLNWCNGSGGCSYPADDVHCLIGGICIDAGTVNPENQCQSCIPAVNKLGWSNNELGCDDGNPCTQNDVCSNGVCQGIPYVCDDGIACTTNICNGDGTCSFVITDGYCLIDGQCYARDETNPANGCQQCRDNFGSYYQTHWYINNSNPCSDFNDCTFDDHCQSGQCVGTAYDCNDGIDCTQDICNGDGTCSYIVLSGHCLIDGICYSQGQSNPSNPCLECNSDAGSYYQTHWYADDTNPGEDDGLSCTSDQCQGGITTHELQEGHCLIGGVCYSRHQLHPVMNCVKCRDDIDPYSWYDAEDFDYDGVCDDVDNCLRMFNPMQTDFDNDGIGDKCDPLGLLEVWGYDYYGQSSGEPTDGGYIQIEAGYGTVLALKADGSIVGWGRDNYGQITDIPAGDDFVSVSLKGYHGLALKADGTVLGWGRNDYGQATPPAGNDYAAIATGLSHSIALLDDGSIIGWGSDSYGQMTDIPEGNDFVSVSANGYHCLALREDGSLCAWGHDNNGQVSNTPDGNDFLDISAGFWHNLALKYDGSIVTWGQNSSSLNVPPAGYNYVAVAAGNSNNLALRNNGTVLGWGHNTYGESTAPAGNTFTDISAGYRFGAVIYNCKIMYAGDINFDCYTDLADLRDFSFEWLQTAEFLCADIDHDGSVDIKDFVLLAESWMKCSHPYDANCQ